MTTLIVAAHPDDEVLGCGGTIARLARQGEDVYVMILGEGATSRACDSDGGKRSAVDDLVASAAKAAKILGAQDPLLCGLPDNRFDTVPLLDVVKRVEEVVDRLRPEVVYTQHGGDLNIDHQLTYRAVLTATRPVAGHPVRSVLAFEVSSSTEWAFQQFAPVFQPNVFSSIDDTLGVKVAALEAYAAEVRPFPHPRSAEALRASAVRWGSVAGIVAAEAFQLVRSVR